MMISLLLFVFEGVIVMVTRRGEVWIGRIEKALGMGYVEDLTEKREMVSTL